MSGFTPGPWAWFGNQHGIYLATTHSGRQYIMAFDRWGMQGAQPSFRRGGIMIPASEIVEFAVGDGKARGFKEGRADESVYRYDIVGLDSPDARLIAAAPDLLAALVKARNTLAGCGMVNIASDICDAAIQKATAASAYSAAQPSHNAAFEARGVEGENEHG